MTRKLLAQPFEKVTETWEWLTDVLSSITHSEQRIALRKYPRERIQAVFRYGVDGEILANDLPLDGKNAVVTSLRDLTVSKDELTLPLWQYSDKPASASWTLTTKTFTFTFAGPYTSFFAYPGEEVLVQFGSSLFRGQLTAYDFTTRAGTVNFPADTGAAIADIALVVPLRDGLASSLSHGLSRAGDTGTATATVDLTTASNRFDGGVSGGEVSPVQQAVGSQSGYVSNRRLQLEGIDVSVKQGTELVETPTAFPYYRTIWNQPAFSFRVSDRFARHDRADVLPRWRALLEALRGSQRTLWIPTRRDDFEIVSVLAQVGIVLKGPAYFNLWNETQFKALCLDNGVDAPVLRQAVFAEIDDNGNTSVQFDVATGLVAPPVQCSLVFFCRMSGDAVTLEHDQVSTTLSFEVETVETTFTPQVMPTPFLDVRPDDVAAEFSELLDSDLIDTSIRHWFTCDSPDNTEAGGGFSVVDAPGTLSTTLVSPAGNVPKVMVNGRAAMDLNPIGGVRTTDASQDANYSFLHAPTGNALITMAFVVNGIATGRILSKGGSSTPNGMYIEIANTANRLRLLVRASSVTYTVDYAIPGNWVFGQVYVLQVQKSANVYTLILDGVNVGSSVAIPGMDATPNASEFQWGRQNVPNAYLCEGIIRNTSQDPDRRGRERAYFDRWKTVLDPTKLVAFRGVPNRGSVVSDFRARLVNRPRTGYWKSRRAVAYDNTTTTGFWRALSATNGAGFTILRSTSITLLSMRFEAGPVAGGNRLIVNNALGNSYKIYYDVNGALHFQIGRSAEFVSANGVIVAGGRYTVQVHRTPATDWYYLDGVLLGSSSLTLSATGITSFELASSNLSNGHRAGWYLGHSKPTAFTSAQREYIRALMLADWPDYDVERFHFKGDDAGAVTSGGEDFLSVPITGEFAGTLLPGTTYDKPGVAMLNGLPALGFTGGEFDVEKVTSGTPVVWAQCDVGATFSGVAAAFGTSPPVVTIDGVSATGRPWLKLRVSTAGPIGLAYVQASFDDVVWSEPFQTRDADLVTFAQFTIGFGTGTYSLDNTWEASLTLLDDATDEANDLTPVATSPRITPFRGRTAFLPGASTFLGRTTLNNARAIVGPMTLVIVGNTGPSLTNTILFGGVNFMRDFRIDGSTQAALVSTVVAAVAGALTANKDFVIIGRWNGASSSLVVYQDGLAPIAGTVNPGDPAVLAMTTFGWGAHKSGVQPASGSKQAALALFDGLLSASDDAYVLAMIRDGYGFPPAATWFDWMQAVTLSGHAQFSLLHNNSINWQFSAAVEAPTNDQSLTIFDSSNVASTAGFVVLAGAGTVQAFIRGTAGFSGPLIWNYDPAITGRFVIEVRFTAGGTPQYELFVNGQLKHSVSLTGFAFATALSTDQAPRIGFGGRKAKVAEEMIRADFTSQANYLRDKWFPALWAFAPVDAGGFPPVDSSGLPPVG